MKLGAFYYKGNLYKLPDENFHVNYVFANPEQFGITPKQFTKHMNDTDALFDLALANGAIRIRKVNDYTAITLHSRKYIDDLAECVIEYPYVFGSTTEICFNEDADSDEIYEVYDITENLEDIYDI